MKILFATDGSYHSDNALETIVNQPWPEGTEVRAITVPARFHASLAGVLGMGAVSSEAEAALMKDVRKLLEDTQAKLVGKFGKEKVTAAVIEGEPAEQIIDAAKNFGADLIVMGSHGTSGYNDESHGSTTNIVLHHAPCSVEIIQYFNEASLEKKGKQKQALEQARFLITLSESPKSASIIDKVLNRPWPQESIFQVLSIVPEPKSVMHSRYFKDPALSKTREKMDALLKEHLEQKVQAAVQQLSARFGKEKVTGHVLVGNVPSLILQVAQDWGADMIMIGAHDRDKDVFEHFMGSVTQNVVGNADCSVEVVRTR